MRPTEDPLSRLLFRWGQEFEGLYSLKDPNSCEGRNLGGWDFSRLIASYELRNTIHFQAGYVRNSCDHRNEGIEFLQLYQQWSLDTSNHTRTSTQRLQLHGVGCEFEADAPNCYRKEGEPIQWAASLTPLRELLALPVRQA